MFEIHEAFLHHGSRLAGGLVKRGLQAVNSGDDVNIHIDVPGWGVILIASTIIISALVLASVRYTLTLVATLAVVEEPQPTFGLATEKPLSDKDEVNTPLLPSELEAVAIVPKRITSKIRTTVRHITQRGGWRARWRGLKYYIALAICTGFTRKALSAVLTGGAHPSISTGYFAAHLISTVVAAVLNAKLHMLWVHTVLTVPGTQNLSTVATFSQAIKKLAPALICNAVATECLIGLPMLTANAYGLMSEDSSNLLSTPEQQFGALMVLLSAFATVFGLWFPSYVALIRVEASLLPENAETMVPFDRTFGGMVVSVADGGCGQLRVLYAWDTVSTVWARLRLFGMFIRIAVVEVVLHIAFACLIVMEVLQFISPEDLEAITRMMRPS